MNNKQLSDIVGQVNSSSDIVKDILLYFDYCAAYDNKVNTLQEGLHRLDKLYAIAMWCADPSSKEQVQDYHRLWILNRKLRNELPIGLETLLETIQVVASHYAAWKRDYKIAVAKDRRLR